MGKFYTPAGIFFHLISPSNGIKKILIYGLIYAGSTEIYILYTLTLRRRWLSFLHQKWNNQIIIIHYLEIVSRKYSHLSSQLVLWHQRIKIAVCSLFNVTIFGLLQVSPRQKHHKIAKRELWKSNVNKQKRQQGQPYQTRHGVAKPARKMGPACTSSYCRKSKFRGCNSVSEKRRVQIYSHFWAMSTWTERRMYAQTLVKKCHIKQKTEGSESHRRTSLVYSLSVDGQLIQVCNRLFSSTLGISDRTIHSWLCTEEGPCPEGEGRWTGQSVEPTITCSSESPKSGPRVAVSTEE